MNSVSFEAIGRIPLPGDNVAIAVRNLDRGAQFELNGQIHTLSHSMLEGHRFAIEPIGKGESLCSWTMPFGRALRDILPGEYVCNAGILDALRIRHLEFELPRIANFQDYIPAVQLDRKSFVPGRQVPLADEFLTFLGYERKGGRGVGTRNDIVILGTSSLTASFARELAARLHRESDRYANIDGIVAVAHTEGGGDRQANNQDMVLRTLAGFMVHPNVGAVLAVDFGSEGINNLDLQSYMRENGYPLDHVLHCFHSLEQSFDVSLAACEKLVRSWLSQVNALERSVQPLSELKIALQCGGSDAFSGVSGNPLAAWVARETIRHGGVAVLAETDELIGAEPYILANTRDYETAEKFLQTIEVFKERVGWHGHSAEGNPSGGNKFRGLYNIALKSIGAARKKDPQVCLDHVIAYGQQMAGPGFYFMDSPGNDLESIAGQVAAGCNMIFFITGNGSITNFPFVPTIKFITTTGRWNLLGGDMDVNAGRYQDGESMDDLGAETFAHTLRVASGMLSVGERAGHSQVSLWRDWRLTGPMQRQGSQKSVPAGGEALSISAPATDLPAANATFAALPGRSGPAADQVGLIVPTSLCSGQIARKIAAGFNSGEMVNGGRVSRFVALPHTEGCGASAGENEDHFLRTLAGHLQHPFVCEAILLEHGCERTHNDLVQHYLEQHGIDADRFGRASIQLDGGIDRVTRRVQRWFVARLGEGRSAHRVETGIGALAVGLFSVGVISPPIARAMARLAAGLVVSGGTVVVPANASLLNSGHFVEELGWGLPAPGPSLDYGQFAAQPGMHVMVAPTTHMVETLTGLGGTGVQLMLAHVGSVPLQGHPMIPLIQVASNDTAGGAFSCDCDAMFDPAADQHSIDSELTSLIFETASGRYRPILWGSGNTDFQLTRGLTGVSL